jgi:hypothetical protein
MLRLSSLVGEDRVEQVRNIALNQEQQAAKHGLLCPDNPCYGISLALFGTVTVVDASVVFPDASVTR